MNRVEYLSRVFPKQKRKKHMKILSFITQFKIEFLLPFTSCRKVLGKMPVLGERLNTIEFTARKFSSKFAKTIRTANNTVCK